jgi:hypothetical protein
MIYPAAYEETVDLTARLELEDGSAELARDQRVLAVLDHQIHWGTLDAVGPVPAGSQAVLQGQLMHLTHGSHQPLSVTVGVFFSGQRVGTVTSGANGRFSYAARVTEAGEWQLRWSRGRHDYATNAVTIGIENPAQLPGPPGYSVGTLTPTTAAMHWSAPRQPGTERITGYRFGWRSSNGKPQAEWQGEWASPPNPLVMISLHPGTTYEMWVQAVTARGAGQRATVRVTTPESSQPPVVVAPGAPRSFTARSPRPRAARLRWATPAHNGGAALDRYQVRLKAPARTWRFRASTRTALIRTLKPNTRYTFAIRAHNRAGWGAWSSTVTVRTPKVMKRRS